MGGPTPEGPGLTFDAGFAPDYWLSVTNGDIPTLFANFARLRTGVNDSGIAYYLGNHDVGAGPVLSGGTNPGNIRVEINNSNVAGVQASCPPPVSTPDFADGSEIDAVYAYVGGSRLYLLITGNLKTDYSKLDLFFDVAPGGQNRLLSTNVDIDYGGLTRYGYIDPFGLTFDTGFAADFWCSFTNGGMVGKTEQYSTSSTLRSNGPLRGSSFNMLDYGGTKGGVRDVNNPVDFAGPRLDIQTGGIPYLYTNFSPRTAQYEVQFNPSAPALFIDAARIALNNSNIGGVSATFASFESSAAVTTGVEFEFRLDELGWGGFSPIRLAGFINNNSRSNVSNQVIGGLPQGTSSLGDPIYDNFNDFAGTQYITLDLNPCTADFKSDTFVDFFDYLDFVDVFSAATPRGDFNRDSNIDFFDYLDFVDVFSIGC